MLSLKIIANLCLVRVNFLEKVYRGPRSPNLQHYIFLSRPERYFWLIFIHISCKLTQVKGNTVAGDAP